MNRLISVFRGLSSLTTVLKGVITLVWGWVHLRRMGFSDEEIRDLVLGIPGFVVDIGRTLILPGGGGE